MVISSQQGEKMPNQYRPIFMKISFTQQEAAPLIYFLAMNPTLEPKAIVVTALNFMRAIVEHDKPAADAAAHVIYGSSLTDPDPVEPYEPVASLEESPNWDPPLGSSPKES